MLSGSIKGRAEQRKRRGGGTQKNRAINPEKQSTQNTTQKNTESRTRKINPEKQS
jgi:hypothetical protein